MSLTHVKSAIAWPVSLPFTFYKAEQYTSGRVQNVGCVYYCCCSYYAAARYTWKSGLAVVDFDWRHLIPKPSTRIFVRCKDLGDICCTSRVIANFVQNFADMATRVGRRKCDWHHLPRKLPCRRKNVTDISHKPILSQISLPWQRGSVGGKCDWQHSMAHPENPSISAKISQISLTQAEL